MATAKRKQEELGEECDDQETHDNDPCSDEEEAKRPRLDLHQHIPHHQLPHHRQWSLAAGADAPEYDACDNSDVKDKKLIDIEAETNNTSARNLDETDYKNVNYNNTKTHSNSFNERSCDLNGYYFNNPYPEYIVSRQFCKETNEAPCDLSNWQIKSKYEHSDREIASTSGSVDSEQTLNDYQNADESSQQPINFAYYHF